MRLRWRTNSRKNSLPKVELKHLSRQEKKEMITRNEIRELANFYADDNNGVAALSFYFQPVTPQDRSHRNQAILAKDIIKEAQKEAAAKGKNGPIHADLDRIL